ncbi:MAG: SUMF1/EgtB/PvdO family nonheme iron enzyme [Saprospiraceae bacterium]|nr:SUMF1/EgtB/PvdO family nonheme iron enzyme [Saprospiraceae bacterium]
MPSPLQLFIAYSRKDSAFLDELRVQLTPLERSGKARIWYDGKIEPGVVWETAIRDNLHSADIILLLVSADAIASDYFYDKELADALARHAAGTARVVPLIVRPCVWQETRLGELQALPKDGKAVTTWSDRDEAYADAVAALTKMVNNILAGRAAEAERLEAERRFSEAEGKNQQRQKAEAEQQRRAAEAAERQRLQQAIQRRQQEEAEVQRKARAAEKRRTQLAELEARLRSPRIWGSVLGALLVLIIGNWLWNQGPAIPLSAAEKKTAATFSDPFANEMRRIKGGTFLMGSTEGLLDKKPAHEVTVPDFFLSKNEVTFSQFQQFMEANPGYQTDADKKGGSYVWDGNSWELMKGINWTCNAEGRKRLPEEYGHPVIHVSWNDAVAFCEWLKKETGLPYRLPTEAEWEYAAGNGAKHTLYSWGNGPPSGRKAGNVADETLKKRFPDWSIVTGYTDGHVFTAPVGQFEPNDFGLHDMSGNVWEWCQDVWHDNYNKGAPNDGSAWLAGGDQTRRVVRGGSWSYLTANCQVTYRNWLSSGKCYSNIGFRLAR